jgi:hypothetical protein
MFPRRLAALCALSFALLAPNAFAQAALTSDPPNFDFGSRVAFTQSPPKAFVITNAGPNDEAFHAILT